MNSERRKRYRGYTIEEVLNLVVEPTSDSEMSDFEKEEEGDNVAPNEPNIDTFYANEPLEEPDEDEDVVQNIR